MKFYKFTRPNFIPPQFKLYIVILVGVVLTMGMVAGCNQQERASPPAVLVAGDAVVGGDELGVVVDKEMKVLGVEPGGAAEKAGVQVGDVLDSVDGISLGKDKDKAKDKIHEPKAGKKLKLKLKRADKDLDLDVSPAPPAPHPGGPTPTPVFAPQDYF